MSGRRVGRRALVLALAVASVCTGQAFAARAAAPAAPFVTALPTLGSVSINWRDDSPEPGKRTYTIYRGTNSRDLKPIGTVDPEQVGTEWFVDYQTVAGKAFQYAVSASRDGVEGPRSTLATAAPATTGTVVSISRWRLPGRIVDIGHVAADGRSGPLTLDVGDHLDPAVAPDVSAMVYSSDVGHRGEFDLWLHRFGTAPRPLFVDPLYSDAEPSFSFDGATIAFTRRNVLTASTSIWTVPTAGGTPTQIPGTDGARQPTWAPDGQTLAIVTPGEQAQDSIVLIGLDGQGRRALNPEPGGAAREPSFSPDGRYVSMVATGFDNRPFLAYRGLEDDAKLQTIPLPETVSLRHQSWAPDGRRIVMTVLEKQNQGPTNPYLWSVDPFGTKPAARQAQIAVGNQPRDATRRTVNRAVDDGPPRVVGLAASSVKVRWGRADGAYRYVVRRATSGASAPTKPDEGTAVYSGNGFEATVGGLKALTSYGLTVFPILFDGSVGPVRTATVRAAAPPVLDVPGPTTAVDTTTTTFPVSWGKTLPRGMTYEVQYGTRPSSNGALTSASYKRLYAGTATTAKLPGKAGTTYYVRARIVDGDATTAWGEVAAAPVPYDDRSLAAQGKWTSGKQTGSYLGTIRSSSAKGAALTLTQNGSAFALLVQKCSACGQVKIFVDGKLRATVDTRSSTTLHRRLVWSMSFSSIGRHTVKVVVVGTKGRPTVRVDGVAARR